MPDDREPTGPEKLQFVAEQMASTPPGQRPSIDCPYCFGRTRRGDVFCCPTLMQAFEAVLDAQDQIRTVEFMDKVLERHQNN